MGGMIIILTYKCKWFSVIYLNEIDGQNFLDNVNVNHYYLTPLQSFATSSKRQQKVVKPVYGFVTPHQPDYSFIPLFLYSLKNGGVCDDVNELCNPNQRVQQELVKCLLLANCA
jgi:hypothetical protein